jgi:glycosyltransferase involved in cell wall biosynthesis
MPEIKTAAIIPAYNEAERVGPVMNAALDARSTDLVVVVDDGSTDGTYEVIKDIANDTTSDTKIHIAQHATNRGKFEALQTGIGVAKSIGGCSLQTLVLIDADLSPIESRASENAYIWSRLFEDHSQPAQLAEHLDDAFIKRLAGYIDILAGQIQDEESIMSIGLPSRNKIIDRLRTTLDWAALAGNRAMPVSLWDAMLEAAAESDTTIAGWQVEAALNTFTRINRDENGIKLNRRISKVQMPDVVNVGSRVKAGGVAPGVARMARVHGSAVIAFAKFSLAFSR